MGEGKAERQMWAVRWVSGDSVRETQMKREVERVRQTDNCRGSSNTHPVQVV